MSVVTEAVQSIVNAALREILKKPAGTRKRSRRRKPALSATQRLRRIEKLLKPAKRQTSRKRTVRARSKAKRRAT